MSNVFEQFRSEQMIFKIIHKSYPTYHVWKGKQTKHQNAILYLKVLYIHQVIVSIKKSTNITREVGFFFYFFLPNRDVGF